MDLPPMWGRPFEVGDHPDRVAVDPYRRSRRTRHDRRDAAASDLRDFPHERLGQLLEFRCHRVHIPRASGEVRDLDMTWATPGRSKHAVTQAAARRDRRELESWA